MAYTVAAMAFALFILYDCNDVQWKRKPLRLVFPLGCLMLLGDYALCLWEYRAGLRFPAFLPGAVLAAGLTVHSLFFALPFDKTYLHPQEKPRVYRRGMYALCRHPGVLWFCLCWLLLALAWQRREIWLLAGESCCLNLGYIVFQELWTFPKLFRDYPDYQKSTPCILPTFRSIRRAWESR